MLLSFNELMFDGLYKLWKEFEQYKKNKLEKKKFNYYMEDIAKKDFIKYSSFYIINNFFKIVPLIY